MEIFDQADELGGHKKILFVEHLIKSKFFVFVAIGQSEQSDGFLNGITGVPWINKLQQLSSIGLLNHSMNKLINQKSLRLTFPSRFLSINFLNSARRSSMLSLRNSFLLSALEL